MSADFCDSSQRRQRHVGEDGGLYDRPRCDIVLFMAVLQPGPLRARARGLKVPMENQPALRNFEVATVRVPTIRAEHISGSVDGRGKRKPYSNCPEPNSRSIPILNREIMAGILVGEYATPQRRLFAEL